ncbi:hypothetical protein MHYP_G00031290 [Metynnis hypsauchen]
MSCSNTFPQRKKQKEALRTELDEEIKEKKETKKKRGWWQRIRLAFRVAYLTLRRSSQDASSSSPSSSASVLPCLSLGPGRFALPRRCFSSSLITSSVPPSPRRSSSAPPATSYLSSTPHSSATPSTLSSSSSCCSSVSVSDKCLDSEPEGPSSPGSNSDVPPSQLEARSEIAPGSAADMCVSSWPLERPVVVQVHSDSHIQRQGVFGWLLHVLRREQGLQKSTGEGRGHSLTNVQQLGFPNIGNTCFMNATLQCLLSLTCFWSPIIAQQASWMDTASFQMFRCLAELQQARLSSSKKQKKQLLTALKSCLSARCPAFDGYDQEDAHEFLMLCLLQLKEEGEALRTSCVSSFCPVEHFEFQLKSVRTCTSCGLQVSRVEDFNHLSINLRSTLADSLHAYFQPTDIEMSCECEQGCQASEVQEFCTLPRFDMLDYGEKLKDAMDIPAQLDLSDFPGVASLGKQSSGSTSPQASPQSSLRPAADKREGGQGEREQHKSPPTGLFRLHGVVSHLGNSLDSGHYISDVAEGEGDSWLTFNDSEVSHTNESAVLKRRAKTAYLLFYVCSGTGENNLPFWKWDQRAVELYLPAQILKLSRNTGPTELQLRDPFHTPMPLRGNSDEAGNGRVQDHHQE